MPKFINNNRRWVSLCIITFLVVVVGVLVKTGIAAEKIGPAIGYKSPDFTLNSVTSKNIELYQVIKSNKVTLINFWGIWCPYCVREIPDLVRFNDKYHQRGVEILAVNVGDNPKNVPSFIKKNNMNFPVLFDKGNAVSHLFQVSGFPTTFIINQQGKIKDIIIGATDQATLSAKVDAILKEK